MGDARRVQKYQVGARFQSGVLSWTFMVQTEDGAVCELDVRDGEEIPILFQMCRADLTVYFDPESKTLTTGWNTPGTE